MDIIQQSTSSLYIERRPMFTYLLPLYSKLNRLNGHHTVQSLRFIRERRPCPRTYKHYSKLKPVEWTSYSTITSSASLYRMPPCPCAHAITATELAEWTLYSAITSALYRTLPILAAYYSH
ncbi:hypothetical protein AVEN_208013-1 [Araneus ventricosus]|uniref:Uncharacterized protein n=1 Tax=Araneus ventricosus TaxID=182803 RepID=A0A4Y2VVG4_ARAVE|nr:hypothetical protein AVEN_208013-1 [Araneus ventricosus]